MTYTHMFINSTRRMVPLSEAAEIASTVEVRVSGFSLVDSARVKFDRHGKPVHGAGGWSYGHVHNGYICAGAGVLNSLRVMPLS